MHELLLRLHTGLFSTPLLHGTTQSPNSETPQSVQNEPIPTNICKQTCLIRKGSGSVPTVPPNAELWLRLPPHWFKAPGTKVLDSILFNDNRSIPSGHQLFSKKINSFLKEINDLWWACTISSRKSVTCNENQLIPEENQRLQWKSKNSLRKSMICNENPLIP